VSRPSLRSKPLTDGEHRCEPDSAGAPLTVERFDAVVDDYARGPLADGAALDALLFAGAPALSLLRERRPPLSAAHRAFLERELARTHAEVSFRIVDADGVERTRLERARVSIGVKQHLHARSGVELQAHEFSGRVERVGVRHLWARY
jgi:hypothetical protein